MIATSIWPRLNTTRSIVARTLPDGVWTREVIRYAFDRSNAYRITSLVQTPSGKVRATIDLVVFNRGQIDVAIIFLGVNQALPASFERALVAKVAVRA